MDKCPTCKYFQRPVANFDLSNIQGTCRRAPPQTMMVQTPKGIAQMTAWPTVTGKDWCGEHQPLTGSGHVAAVDAERDRTAGKFSGATDETPR